MIAKTASTIRTSPVNLIHSAHAREKSIYKFCFPVIVRAGKSCDSQSSVDHSRGKQLEINNKFEPAHFLSLPHTIRRRPHTDWHSGYKYSGCRDSARTYSAGPQHRHMAAAPRRSARYSAGRFEFPAVLHHMSGRKFHDPGRKPRNSYIFLTYSIPPLYTDSNLYSVEDKNFVLHTWYCKKQILSTVLLRAKDDRRSCGSCKHQYDPQFRQSPVARLHSPATLFSTAVCVALSVFSDISGGGIIPVLFPSPFRVNDGFFCLEQFI